MWFRWGAYAVLGALVSVLQFQYFDCSELPVLSFVAGTAAIWVALITAERVYQVGRPTAGRRARPGTAMMIGGVGAAVAVGLGWFTLMTHLCG